MDTCCKVFISTHLNAYGSTQVLLGEKKKKLNKRLAVGSIWLKAVASALKVSSTPSISTSSF